MQVFVVADGGLDLEHFEPRSFEELQSILMQVRALLITLSLLNCPCMLPVYLTVFPSVKSLFLYPFCR